MQIITRGHDVFDAVVVGSGATGGWAAKQLTEAGMKVAVLEAGSPVTPDQFGEHVPPYQLKYRDTRPNGVASPEIARRRPVQARQGACSEVNYRWFADDVDNPYTTPKDKPFVWVRVRAVGGRSLAWGRQSYRMSDLDFRAPSRDGVGVDWPISYADLAPYYDRVERYVGISGQAEGLAHFPDGQFLPPMEMTCPEKRLRTVLRRQYRRTATIGRTAILTRPHNGRAACHYCGPCNRGCITYSYFSSPFTTLAAAERTGNLTLITDAPASHVTVDRSTGRASGVAYVDRRTRAAREIRARHVILCASTLESVRLLLNSAPGGLANSSGTLGRYLMDHMYGGQVTGRVEGEPGGAWHGPPRRPNGIFIPRFRNVDRPHTRGMIRGYSYQGSASPSFNRGAPGFGRAFKEAVVEPGRWSIGLHGFVECLPNRNNRAVIDPDVKDAWGIPALRIEMTWSDNEYALFRDALTEGAEMLEASGAKDVKAPGRPKTPGDGIHEVGGARMGNDPKTSVLDQWCRTHDIPNLLVTDGAAYPSMGTVNPTLTMMANTVRACDGLINRARNGGA